MDKGHKGPHRIGNDLKLFHRPLAKKKDIVTGPTSPPISSGISTARGDYKRRKNPLNTFCFVFLSFLLLLFAQRWTYEKEELYANGIAVYLLHPGIGTL